MHRFQRHVLGLAFLLALGCQHHKHQLACKFPEEYTLPPDEPRFNNPPESGYKRPPARKDSKVAPGGAGPAGFGVGRGGSPGGGFSGSGVPGGP